MKDAGLNPWLDRESLIAGQNWKISIKKAIKKSRYFIPLFSSICVEKRGYVQREFKYALEVFDEIPESQIYVIPCRLDDCEIPYEKFEDIEYVDLFHNWEEGMKRILQAMVPSQGHKDELTAGIIIPARPKTSEQEVETKLIEKTSEANTAIIEALEYQANGDYTNALSCFDEALR